MRRRKLTSLQARVLRVIQQKPRLGPSEICRELNKKWKYYCGRRVCFANTRKLKTMVTFPSTCEVKRGSVFSAVSSLERKGLILTRRERKADMKNPRGWDWFRACYPLQTPLNKRRQKR